MGTEWGEGPNSQIFSVKRAANERRQRSREIIEEEREKSTGQRTDFCKTPQRTQEERLVTLINHTSVPIRKERLSPMSKVRRGPTKMSSWKRTGCQTESKAFEKSIVKRIVQDLGLGLLNPSQMD